MALALDRDPQFWNGLANDPAIRPFLGPPTETTDISETIAFPLNVPLRAEGGGFLFVKHEIGRFELHTMFRPGERGRKVLDAFAEAARWLFTRTDCTEIVTKTAGSNRAAAQMAALAGFRVLFMRPGAAWDGTDFTYHVLTVDEWVQRDKPLPAEGHAFHRMLEAAKREAGSTLPTHPDDEPHDRMAGAASLMAKNGQPAKAAWIYSRWAKLAGYRTIELIEDEPPVLDVRDALIEVRDGRLEVVECR